MKLSIASLGAEPSARFLDQVRLAERLGFHAFFHNDKKWAQDVYARLGAATQVSRRASGSASAPPIPTRAIPRSPRRRPPASPRWRPAASGWSSAPAAISKSLPGTEPVKPVTALREAIGLMRKLWAGERVTLDGEVIKFKDGALDAKPAAVPQVYIASRGPMILKLAGEIADGAMIGSFATPAGIAYAKSHIEKGLEGRRPRLERSAAALVAVRHRARPRRRSGAAGRAARGELRVLEQPQRARQDDRRARARRQRRVPRLRARCAARMVGRDHG